MEGDLELLAVQCSTAFLTEYNITNKSLVDKLPLLFPHVTTMKKLTSAPSAPLQTLVDMDVCPKLLECIRELLASHQAEPFKVQSNFMFEALWVISNIGSGELNMVQHIMDNNALATMIDVVAQWNDPDAQDQAVWCIGNIAADCEAMRDLVLECTGLFQILFAYEKQQNFTVSMAHNLEWAFQNLCRGDPSRNFDLVQPLYLRVAERLQQFQQLDSEVLKQMLLSLTYLLHPRTFLPEECLNMLMEQNGILHNMMRVLRIPDTSQHRTCLGPSVARLLEDYKHERINDFEAQMVSVRFNSAITDDQTRGEVTLLLYREINHVFTLCEQQDYHVAITLLSATSNSVAAKRIGRCSKLRMLPSDLIRMLIWFFVKN